MLAHGADDETRQMGTIIPMLAEAGLTVFSFDQRGTGESGGAWRSDGIVRIAEDMVQAARLLRSGHGIASVGFYGFSNGGWIAPAAAARLGDPSFLILKRADSGTVEQNVRFEQSTAVKQKFGPEAALHAGALLDLAFQALHTDTPEAWSKVKKALIEAKGESWIASLPLPPPEALPLSPAMAEGFRRQLDPAADLRALQCPVLILLGSGDTDVNAAESEQGYRKIFAASGNRRVTIRVFPGAGHQLATGPAADSSLITGTYAPGFPEAMLNWIR